MRPQAHVASAFLVWSASRAPLREAALCAVAANLPDFDRNVAKWLGVRRRDHHRWVSHSFVGWLPPTLVALCVGRGSGAVRRAAALVWIHLILDTYADGIAWLWPFRTDKIGLFRKPPEIRDDGWRTPAPLSAEAGRVEAAMWGLGALALLSRARR
ncbi:MAG: metal-dependent hydrolase [Actinomycetota bacterium]|nr:metal-dependent hydrolase [Actinomycetota bacterium]